MVRCPDCNKEYIKKGFWFDNHLMFKHGLIRSKKVLGLDIFFLIIGVILGLYITYAFHYGLVDKIIFKKNPNIEIMITAVEFIHANTDFNVSSDLGREALINHLKDRERISGGLTPAYRIIQNPKTNIDYFNIIISLEKIISGKTNIFGTIDKILISPHSYDLGLKFFITGSNKGTKCVDSLRIKICLGKEYFINQQNFKSVEVISDKCVAKKINNLCQNDELLGEFYVKRFGVYPEYMGEDIFSLIEVRYSVWNQDFNLNEDQLHKTLQIFVDGIIK